MNILVIFDGSGDGFKGLVNLVSLLGPSEKPRHFIHVVVGWPPRPSPIWDRAFERHVVVDDLHRAMAEIAGTELDRMRSLFAPLGEATTRYLEGEPVSQIAQLVKDAKVDLIFAGLTRGDRLRSINDSVVSMLQHTSVPALLSFGPNPEAVSAR